MKNMAYKHFRITIKIALICIATLMIFSCGGGGGGGMVSFQDNPGIHNNGDAGGFGTGNQTGSGFDPQGQNIEDAEAGPLISQMAALDVSTVDIRLTVNNDEQPLIVADATTTTAVLPKIKPGYIVSGTATIHLADGTARTAVLDETEATLHGVLKFKVPYNYTANDLSGTQVASGTYFARDGINLAAQTVDPIAGWQCAEDGSIHYGGYVAGVRGDITLNAVLGDGAPALTATASQNVLYATATSFDTTMITITNVTGTPRVSDISSQLIASVPVADNPLNPTSYTLTIGFASGSVWFGDNTSASVTITDDSGATTSVPLTLKNKYSYVLLNHAGEGGTITRGPENAGYELTFANAKSIVSTYATSVPAGRSIIAFKDTTTNTVYKEADFPIKFSSTNFSSRSITLQAMLGFGMTISGGKGDGNTHTGTEADPYILKYNGTDNTDATKITVNITGNEGSIIARNADTTGKLTIGHPGNTTATQYITINKTAFAASDIPAAGLTFQITVRDYRNDGAGSADNDACLYSKKTFWVKIPQPEYTISFNTAGGSAVDDISVPMGINSATMPSPGPVKTNCVFWGWYTDAGCTTAFDFSSITGDAIAYAKWLAVDATIPTVITSGDGLAAYVNTDGNKYLLSLQDFNYTAGLWESATKFVNNNAGSTTDMYIDIQGTNKFIGGNHGGLKFVNIYSGWDPSSPGGTINVTFCTASSGTLELGFQYSGTNGCIQTDYVTVNFSVASGCTVSEMKIGDTEYSNFDSFISDARTNTDSSKRATFKITRN